jgi:ferredoxin
MQGISRFGYPHTVVTSSFIARPDAAACSGCAKCAKACPIQAITMRPVAAAAEGKKKKQEPVVDAALCMGCGVCALDCSTGAMRLDKRGQRVIHPETTFERVVLQCLDHGTLQNLIFDDPGSISQDAMRAILGAFLALPPVKKGLMSDALRSRFLGAMKSAVARQGKADLLEP